MRARLAGLVAIALAAGGGVTAVQLLRPRDGGVTTAPAGVVTQVNLPANGLAAVPVCPGPQTLVAPPGGQPTDPRGPVVVGAAVRHVDPPAGTPRRPATLGGKVVGTGEGEVDVLTLPRTSPGAVPLQVPPGVDAPPVSAVELGLARSGEARGLAALACPTATTRSWLVGGGTQAGRRALLLLANPAATPAEVDVTVHGPRGPVTAPAGTGVVVPARGIRALRVDALAADLEAVAVLVQVRTGRVSATLHDSYVRGLTPSGVDDVTPAAPPARRQVVPGISVAPPPGAAPPRTATAPGAVAVRVVNPGPGEAVVGVRLVGAAGPVALPDGVLSLAAGEVRDVPVTAVPRGTYAAVVEADVPVVAGALVGRAGSNDQLPAEFGWAPSVEALAGPALLALPRLTESTGRTALGAVVTVAAPGRAGSVEIGQFDDEGRLIATDVVAVPAASTAGQALSPRAAAVRVGPVPGSGPLLAAVVLQVQDQAGVLVSVLPVHAVPAPPGTRPRVVPDVRLGLG